MTKCVIAEDEALLRDALVQMLEEAWPELEVVAVCDDGGSALEAIALHQPEVAFLDIRMPGLTGLEAAREIVTLPSWSGEIVFVTAYDEYAVAAFEQGALDYLLKPVEPERLAQTAQRVKARLKARQPRTGQGESPADETTLDALLEKLLHAQQSMGRAAHHEPPMRWIQCAVGSTTKLIDVKDVLFFRSDEKYTRVQTRDQEALIRTPIRELLPRLDDQQFWQIHRGTIVNLSAIAAVTRDDTGRQRVHISGHPEVLEVSRSFAHLFRAS